MTEISRISTRANVILREAQKSPAPWKAESKLQAMLIAAVIDVAGEIRELRSELAREEEKGDSPELDLLRRPFVLNFPDGQSVRVLVHRWRCDIDNDFEPVLDVLVKS